MKDLTIDDFEAFKKTPEATAKGLAGAGDYVERQKAIIAANEAAGYYESSPEADWENAQGSTGYTPLDEEDFNRADRQEERKQFARELDTVSPTSRSSEAMESTRALLTEQEWIDSYEMGYGDGYGDGEKAGQDNSSSIVRELEEQLGEAQLEIVRLRKLLGR